LKKGNVGFNEEDYVTLILLSTGFEHLMKCIICLRYYHIHKKYPTLDFIKKNFGHDLHKSKKYIEKELGEMNYGSRLATKNDIEFLKNNQHLDNFISLLSQFGNGARYYNLDIVTEGDSHYKDPRNVFDDLINEIIKEHPRLEKLRDDISRNKEFDERLSYELIVLVEKFARALSRLFSLGDFGSLAKTMTGNVSCFFLRDTDLGKAEYCNKII